MTAITNTAGQILPDWVKPFLVPVYKQIRHLYWAGRCVSGINYYTYRFGDRTVQVYYTVESAGAFSGLVPDGIVTTEQIPLDLLEVNERVNAVIDVGAHFGTYTVLFELLNRKIDVYAFEPDDYNRDVLKRVVEENEFDTHVRPEVVAEETSVVDLYTSNRDGSERNSISAIDGFETVEKQSVSLSDFIEERGLSSVFVKIDAEGAELDILRDLLSAPNEYVAGIVEVHPEKLSEPPEEVIRLLESACDDYQYIAETSPSHVDSDSIEFEHNRPMYYFVQGDTQ
ncbi:FkbM family methyltransferase [Halosimplex halophilum]|uniref:FkbM family methyltransferase n=1 Tax=Halosimplex halophilum TaxID=2559572 RepID=UPI00107FB834|nr:FkbM family methyltransferase [Halosimplex halophilum]